MKLFRMKAQEVYLLIIFLKLSTCEYDRKEASKSKNPLPYFRRTVDGLHKDLAINKQKTDSNSNLVALLVNNVKEIFNDLDDGKEFGTDITATINLTTGGHISTKSTTSLPIFDVQWSPSNTDDVMLYENLTITHLLDHSLIEPLSAKNDLSKFLKSDLNKELKPLEKVDVKMSDVTPLTSISSYILETTEDFDLNDGPKRSCIFCNNVNNEKCNDPQNKLIPSVTCERDGDVCYSQHTPFGVIDRGCFNINYNLTTYVCSCNLCNYISISEMPHIFSTRQDWIDNVVELSRTRNFRKSLFKDMSCLQCEVNTTTKTGNMLHSVNCLEGNIGNLPIQDCEENEICAVKALRNDGYLWRGCVRVPLYNYWWSLCKTDLCNHDSLLSLYDFPYIQQ